MRDRLIELIDKVLVKYDRGCLPFVMNEIADYLIANGVTVQEWISVKDRLPDRDAAYLVSVNCFGRLVVRNLRFAKDGREIDDYDFEDEWENVWYGYDGEYGHYTIDGVTHWMPLPQPPKGE